jgi:hypothetical protein
MSLHISNLAKEYILFFIVNRQPVKLQIINIATIISIYLYTVYLIIQTPFRGEVNNKKEC